LGVNPMGLSIEHEPGSAAAELDDEAQR